VHDLLAEALNRFETIYRQVLQIDPSNAALMALATAGSDARSSVRTVRFTGLVHDRFTFFTNRTSGKGYQLAENPWAGLSFFWAKAEQQIVVEGPVEALPDADVDRLWRTRPRAAALMAWASDQSRELSGPDALDVRLREVMERFSDRRVPRPPDWVAYGVQPHRIEFWHGIWARREYREAYMSMPDGWRHAHLNP
jgi:pyridoxamine 5'-phosphate oxidase